MQRREHASVRGCAVAAAALSGLLVLPAAAEIIDRVLAVVQGQLITLSDVRAVIRLGLETSPPGNDPIRLVLDKLIDRQIILAEVERYLPPEPRPDAIEARLGAIRARFPDELALETTLTAVGMTRDDLRRYVRDTLRIEAYLEQRFAGVIQPTDEEVTAYYQLHQEDFTRDGTPIPFPQAMKQARMRLVEARRATLIRDWLAGLRRRADIIDLYLITPTPVR